VLSDMIGKLVVVEGPEPRREYGLVQATTLIGREPDLHIVLAAPGISRRHARVIRRGDEYLLEDTGSSNGTFINGERITDAVPLRSGDNVSFGRLVTMQFLGPAGDATEVRVLPEEQLASPPTAIEEPSPRPVQIEHPKLSVTVSGAAKQSYELNKAQITIGRNPDNDIVLSSPIISRYHARLSKINGGYQIEISPQASNPVFYRNQPLSTPQRLADGDQLRIGKAGSDHIVLLAYHSTAAVPAAAPAQPSPAPAVPDGGTVIAEDFEMPETTAPPELQVAVAGNPPRTYTLQRDALTLGRSPDNDIVIDSRIVSRFHARIVRQDGGYQIVPSSDAGNPVLFEGRPLTASRRLHHEDKLRIGGADPGSMVTMTYLSPAEALPGAEAQAIEFGEKTTITIGRDSTNDVVLDIPIVSRYHAQVERVGQRYRVRDLRSSNGTFVNGERTVGDVWLTPNDTIRIGPYSFVMGQDQLAQFDETGGLQLDAFGLNKWVRKDLNILQDISLTLQPREFIVVVGQSGGGKSTLIDALAGYRPATHGQVYVNDIELYRNFDAVRNDIGYVPQRDIIHMELTVFQALDYSAQLRMPPDTTRAERHKRVEEVMQDLDLAHRKGVQISGLSGGQQKRVSIGVELLTKPGLFFLDEPTSGLDPGTETALMQLMRRLADQGRTIILITHATKNVMLADKVVFLARGGYLAWFGPPDEALKYFDQFREERDRRARDIEFDEIYAILGDSNKGEPADWGKRYRQHQAYQEYVIQPLQLRRGDGLQPPSSAKATAPKPKRHRQVSSIRQFAILSARNLKILTRDRFSLALMLAAAPIVSLLDVILALVLGSNPFDFTEGFMPNVLITMFLLTVYGVMVGGLAMMREIVKEQDVYKRERLVNLRILPYVLSKVWVAALLALYQTVVYVVVHYLVFDMPGGVLEFGVIYVTLAMATMAGMMLGLFASALAPNPNAAPLIIILLMLPQIVLGGALVPLPEIVSAPTSTRWAFQAFMAITESGSDVARDACYLLPEEQQQELSLDYRDANCNCKGTNALREESCNFPGIGAFYRPAIDEAPPVEPGEQPAPPGDRPPEPELPPKPEEPADDTDFVALSEYRDALRIWEAEVEEIQNGYRADIAEYEAEVNIYQAELEAYQAEVVDYQTARAEYEGQRLAAVGPAENVIGQSVRDFGWTFVDKQDTGAYWGTLGTTWIAQAAIIGLLFVAILILQKRKDVN
jgi:ABC-type multidrug transport system ATPase subunit/pSer/pThr/pTyr-binding forkhead associated (FHA) protein